MEKELEQDLKACFSRAICCRRRELDVSQEVLAEQADLHRTYVSDIEQGSRNPSLVNIVQLAMGLEITVARLFMDYGVEGGEYRWLRDSA